MKKKILIALSFIAALGMLYALSVDVSGEWELTSQGRRGPRTSTITITQDGEKITVTMPGMRGDPITAEGTISGNKIEWSATRTTPRGDFTITYTGTVNDAGNEMSGEMAMGDFGTSEWTAKKK